MNKSKLKQSKNKHRLASDTLTMPAFTLNFDKRILENIVWAWNTFQTHADIGDGLKTKIPTPLLF